MCMDYTLPSILIGWVGVMLKLPLIIGIDGISLRFSCSSFIFIWATTRAWSDAAKPLIMQLDKLCISIKRNYSNKKIIEK